jgi:hypothetical protein
MQAGSLTAISLPWFDAATEDDVMRAKVTYLEADSVETMEELILDGIVKGYTVANKSADSVVLISRVPEFNLLAALVLFVLFVLPAFLYAIAYAFQRDEIIDIHVNPSLATTESEPSESEGNGQALPSTPAYPV